jgi:DegV family protein with EDD domain
MRIVTDSAADLLPEDIREHNIHVVPLYIQFPEGEINSDSLTPDEFYDRLLAVDPEIPTTAQPSAGIFAETFRELAVEDTEILAIHISSGLSGTIDSSRLGAKEISEADITTIDTLTLSGGERFQILAAAKAIKAGWKLDQIKARLSEIQKNTEVIYTLETLKYLARGGRIGRVAALAGSVLKLKPIINVDKTDGKYNSLSKVRTIRAALQAIANNLSEVYADTPVWVTVLHGQFAGPAQDLEDLFRETLNISKIELCRISPILGVHTGPGIVGAAVVPMSLMSGIE